MFYSFGESAIKSSAGELRGHTRRQLFPIRLLPVEGSWKDYRIYSLHGAKDADIEGIFEGNKRFILLLDMEHNLKIHKGRGSCRRSGAWFHFRVARTSMPGEDISEISYDGFRSFPEESLGLLIARSDDG